MIPILKSSEKAKLKTRKKILAIDDDNSIRALLQILLQRRYDVVSMEDGYEALLWLEQGNIPDLIIADIHMPKMDGMGFVKTIKKSGYYREIPVIVLSGSDDTSLKSQFEATGIQRFYQKPFNPNVLLADIEELFRDNKELKVNFRYA